MTRLAYRFVHNVEDARALSQEGFVRAFQRLRSYRSGSRFDRWLSCIVANAARDFLRRRKRVAMDGVEERLARLPASSPTPDQVAEWDDLNASFRRERAALPYTWRSVFVLHEQEQLSHAEIGGLLDENVRTVRWRLYKARQRLRERRADFLAT